ncbi:methyltransferase [Adhaeribacter sp. BT258]|uniref:tRNA1(Val) (adenine(37)-N6)-methyltransferase n=1 Tax=Adhaeribacter terrigena TaxID=2793070 RepID=A0ABS1C0Q5_9BACT|nr:methyltransferase [Adhaeribacter terrigena]MBK0402110.1 methyltransferase [Adhaeribacter terrigena]
MANAYFQFKQFRINQDRTAMKVCTDSCVLGAWAEVKDAKQILDIGTGTGLLSLMVAQRSHAQITAVEIDAAAAAQAEENFAESPWKNRIVLAQKSLQQFGQENQQQFDVIICNPPFFQASLKSPDTARTIAKHTQELPFEDLVHFVKQFLTPEGIFYLLLPPAEAEVFRNLAFKEKLFPARELQLFTQPDGKHLRTIYAYSFWEKPTQKQSLIIRNPDQAYTADFATLLKDYYLIF